MGILCDRSAGYNWVGSTQRHARREMTEDALWDSILGLAMALLLFALEAQVAAKTYPSVTSLGQTR